MARFDINSAQTGESCILRNELYSDHEEADTRLLLHAKHALSSHDHLIIRSPEIYVFIFLLGHKPSQFHRRCILFNTGVGNERRILNINEVYASLVFIRSRVCAYILKGL